MRKLSETPELRRLIEVCADASRRALVLASAGNVSIRVDDEHFAVTGSGVWFDRVRVSDFALMSISGEHVAGATPSSEWLLHQRAYLARSDVRCVMHLHPQTATLLATLNVPLRLLTLDHAYYVGSVAVSDFYDNGSEQLADQAAALLRNTNCVLMKHHGCSVVAESVDMAYRRALNLESAAQATLVAAQLGDSQTVFPQGGGVKHA